MPPFEPQDMPSLVRDVRSYPAFAGMLVNQFSNLDKVDWVLCNSVYELEQEVADWFMKILPFRTIGPTVPSTYLDNRLEQDKEYGFSIFQPDHDTTMTWLSTKPKGSVVYVSFGSMAELKIDQMHELAMGLSRSNCYFLWVVRSSEAHKLPQGFANGAEEASQKGLIVTWCSKSSPTRRWVFSLRTAAGTRPGDPAVDRPGHERQVHHGRVGDGAEATGGRGERCCEERRDRALHSEGNGRGDKEEDEGKCGKVEF